MIDVVRRMEPRKSKTFIASRRVFRFTPSARPSFEGMVNQAIKRQIMRKGIWIPNSHLHPKWSAIAPPSAAPNIDPAPKVMLM